MSAEDPLGEGADLSEMGAFSLRRGVVPLEADRITSAFASYPTDGEKLMTWEQREAKLLEKKRRSVSSPRKAVNDDKQILLAPSQSSEAAVLTAETTVIALEPNEAGVHAVERSKFITTPVKGYVISISGKRRVRRLHFVGMCHRIPGLDFLDFECHDDQLPVDNLYDDYCHQCWRTGPPAQRGDDSVVTESESSSTGSECA